MEDNKFSQLTYTAGQQQVRRLNPAMHALLLGAAGSGKTTALLAAAAQHQNVLFFAPNRQAAARLKQAYLQLATAPAVGAVAQTMQAFALQLLAAAALQQSTAQPRLLTAVLQDELITQQLQRSDFPDFQHETNRVYLRTEIRNLWQLFEELDLTVTQAAAQLEQHRGSFAEQVFAAITVLSGCEAQLANRAEYSATGVLNAAGRLIQETPGLALPQLVIVDDAAELTLAEQRFLKCLAGAGVAVWAAADPDTAAQVHIAEPLSLPELLTALPATSAMLQAASSAGGHAQDQVQQLELLEIVRYPAEIAAVTKRLSGAIGVRGTAGYRQTTVSASGGEVAAFNCDSPSALSSAIAYQLRQAKLGLEAAPLSWEDMVVVCRSRDTVAQLCRELSHRGVPTKTSGGGIVLRDHAIVRSLVLLLQAVIAEQTLGDEQVQQLLIGPLGGFTVPDVALLKRDLLVAVREGAAPETPTAKGLLAQLCAGQLELPPQPSAAAQRVAEFAQIMQVAAARKETSSLSELLWLLWDGLCDAAALQQTALSGSGDAARDANQLLDTVLELFYVVQRNESQELGVAPLVFLAEIMASEVPQDTLARQAQRPAVTVTTPHMLLGREFAVVCVADLQEGLWPNLRSRDAYLQLAQVQAVLRQQPEVADRYQLLHAETRLLLLACSRAVKKLCLFTVTDDEKYPSPLWRFFADYLQPVTEQLLHLTLRGEVARLRAAVEHNPQQLVAAGQLARLAAAGVAGADPEQWYGAGAPSGETALFSSAADITLSPSTLVALQQCAAGAVLNQLNGQRPAQLRAAIGTLLHAGLEHSSSINEHSCEAVMQPVQQNWGKLPFKNAAIADLELQKTAVAAENIAKYTSAQSKNWQVLGSEVPFQIEVAGVKIRGVIDRIEQHTAADGSTQIRIVDLKTAKTPVAVKEAEQSLQLAAYQYAVAAGGLQNTVQPQNVSGIQAVLVFPKYEQAATSPVTERSQKQLDASQQAQFEATVEQAVETLQGTVFEIDTSGQCKNSLCELQLIPAVSWQE